MLGALLLLLLLLGGPAQAEEPAPMTADEATAALRRAARGDLPAEQRLALVQSVLERARAMPTVPAVRAGSRLLAEAPEVGGWLIHRGLVDGYLPTEEREAAVKAVETQLGAATGARARSVLAAIGMRLGHRPDEIPGAIIASWPPAPVVLATLREDVGSVPLEDGSPLSEQSDAAAVRTLLEAQLPALRLLDQAAQDDLTTSRAGLDGLKTLAGAAVPLLLHEVRKASETPAVGRSARATRAALVLGLIRDRRATPVLIQAMGSKDGWLRAYAATALGDLGDPAAVIALARQCTLLGDPDRQRDQWEYPGTDNTPIPESQWASAEYYAIDTAAADSLLRLGVRGAAGWLITNQLDPRKKYHRIRVLQDATDALRRSVKDCPVQPYNVDGGLPQREAAWLALLHWWHDNRKTVVMRRTTLDTSDPRYQAAAAGLANVFAGPKVREMMMAKAAIGLLGPDMTEALLASIPTARNAFHRAELAESLGLVDDARAVAGLMQLVRDKQIFVRKKAVKSLGSYVEDSPEALGLLLRFLSSKRAGLRVAAMEGLVNAPPSARVREAIDAWLAEDVKRVEGQRPTWRSPDVEIALTVVRLVQDGNAHLPAVLEGLAHEQRAKRRIWWDLVRAALDLPEPLHDPVSSPDTAWARRIDEATLRAAVERRRGA
ncbi:MAG: HEAT repeat domain-containing protein [Planctomycetota bacterium]|nr:HEAT repeat domain-containing protein [Planctomycetota bacterium]